MTWRELPPPSVFERLAARYTEREFTALVDRAFRMDSGALLRVRATVLAQGPALAPRISMASRGAMVHVWRGLPAAMAAVVVVAAGLVAAVATRPGGSTVASGVAAERVGQAIAALDRSTAQLQVALATIRSGDGATIATVLLAYRNDLLDVESDLQRPGADLLTAATSLQSQATALSTMGSLVPVEDTSIFTEVTGELDRIIASLPGAGPTSTDHPSATDHPSKTDHPGNTDHPSRTDHPGANGGNASAKSSGGSAAGSANGNGSLKTH